MAVILIVEDDPGTRLFLEALLLQEAYHVIMAANGLEALQRMEERACDLVLMDIQMPEMDGYEVCRLLKEGERTREIPVLFVTAKSEVADEIQGFELGAADYLVKPVSPPVVLARVKTHIEMKQRGDLLAHYVKIVDKYVITSATDPRGVITYASDAFCQISGYSREELVGQPHSIIRHPDMPSAFFQTMWETLLQGEQWSGEIKNLTKDGGHYWVDVHIEPNKTDDGRITGFTSIRHNITDKKRIEELSVTDRLTQLYNRLMLDEAFSNEIARAGRFKHPLSVILCDVDHFKSVNDTFGHQVGDEVLVHLAQLLRANVRKFDIPGRWGGEEFLIICPETDTAGAMALAEKLRQAIAAHDFPVVGHKTSSFGVGSLKPNETTNALVHRVDAALYRAKRNGRDRVELAVAAFS
ncbi:MAG: diguanylate cyclase [Magnetococcales bacterium]|nr:diguanylate cyclase [Magnetococcales bacterium]